ncbi:UNKNOWN [Stylonychia lemnae]|uniref:Uncharacterized protein n=1 Tax=Stylonychia lemnae TaxID=5949 RepID=A0A078AJC3_STYLE|nr:UNKNOWN [Stylonychia lemnae]|eukprot:CDW82334.1 UNKNOWN [Stylonychia lemnae]
MEFQRQKELKEGNEYEKKFYDEMIRKQNRVQKLKNFEDQQKRNISKSRQMKIKQIFDNTKNHLIGYDDQEDLIYTIRSLSKEQKEHQYIQDKIMRLRQQQSKFNQSRNKESGLLKQENSQGVTEKENQSMQSLNTTNTGYFQNKSQSNQDQKANLRQI